MFEVELSQGAYGDGSFPASMKRLALILPPLLNPYKLQSMSGPKKGGQILKLTSLPKSPWTLEKIAIHDSKYVRCEDLICFFQPIPKQCWNPYSMLGGPT